MNRFKIIKGKETEFEKFTENSTGFQNIADFISQSETFLHGPIERETNPNETRRVARFGSVT